MTKIKDQVELYVSCRPQRPPKAFCVDPGKVCLLQACGLAPGQTVPLLKSYGDGECQAARDLGGDVLEMTASKPSVLVAVPGNYKLDVSGLGVDPCVYITEQCMDASDAAALGGGGNVPFEGDIEVDLQPILDCLEQIKEKGRLHVSHVVGCAGDGSPSILRISTVCADDGTMTTTEELLPMAVNFTPVSAPSKTCERVDLLPFYIEAGTAAQTYTEIVTAAIAANPATYPTFGAAAATDDVLTFNAVPEAEGGYFLQNGEPSGGINDPDGVNMANTIETTDCRVRVDICLQKCLTKAEIAALKTT